MKNFKFQNSNDKIRNNFKGSNSKIQNKKLLNSVTQAILFGTFENLNFGFVSDFEYFKFFNIYHMSLIRHLDLS